MSSLRRPTRSTAAHLTTTTHTANRGGPMCPEQARVQDRDGFGGARVAFIQARRPGGRMIAIKKSRGEAPGRAEGGRGTNTVRPRLPSARSAPSVRPSLGLGEKSSDSSDQGPRPEGKHCLRPSSRRTLDSARQTQETPGQAVTWAIRKKMTGRPTQGRRRAPSARGRVVGPG